MNGSSRKPSYRNGYQRRREVVDRYWGQRNGYGQRYGNEDRGQ